MRRKGSVATIGLGARKKGINNLSEFRIGLHVDQQSLILGELVSSKKKLEEENQRLRDELQDAQLVIHLLKLKLEDDKVRCSSTVSSQRSAGAATEKIPSVYIQQLEKAQQRKAKKRLVSRKEAFRNPAAPGSKTFQVSPSLGMSLKEIVVPLRRNPRPSSAPRLREQSGKIETAERRDGTVRRVNNNTRMVHVDKHTPEITREYSQTTDSTSS